MAKKHDRKTAGSALAYEKSAVAAGALIVVFLFFLGMLAEPQSGEIRNQRAAWLAFLALPFAIAAVFYVEYRFRNRRIASSVNRSSPQGNLSAKC